MQFFEKLSNTIGDTLPVDEVVFAVRPHGVLAAGYWIWQPYRALHDFL